MPGKAGKWVPAFYCCWAEVEAANGDVLTLWERLKGHLWGDAVSGG